LGLRIKKEKDVDRTQSIVKHTGRKLDYTIIAVLAVALAYYVYDDVAGPQSQHEISPGPVTDLAAARSDDSDTIVDKSIAVLPFVNLSSDQEQEWFADGLTEEVLNALTKARDLLVTARTSSFKFKGTNQEIPEIAKQLGVAHILEGSVRKGGDRIRVTAQLIRAEDGFHLWSETYDRDETDVISIQEDLAMAIAGALKTAMDPEALAAMMSAGTRSVPAYEAYLEGQALGNEVSATGTKNLNWLANLTLNFQRHTGKQPSIGSHSSLRPG
jgi:TolB-like protein